MRLRDKIIVGYCIVALLIAVVGYLGVRATREVAGEFSLTSDEHMPELKALEELKTAGMRIISSVTEHALLVRLSTGTPADRAAIENERGHVGAGQAQFRQALREFTRISGHKQTEHEEGDDIRLTGERLCISGDALLKRAESGASRAEVFQLKELYEGDETRFLDAVDRALVYENREVDESKVRVSRAISTAEITVGVLSLLVALMGVLVGTRQAAAIIGPLRRLGADAERIGRGDLDTVIVPGPRDEIGQLAGSFDRMRCDIKETQEELRNARNELDNIITSMLDSLVVFSPDGIIRMVNRATCQMLGYDGSELVGTRFETVLMPSNDRECCLEKLLEMKSCNCQELSYRRKDGSTVPVALSGAALLDVNGMMQGYVCVALDITERKRAEEDIRRLNDELELRVAERTAQLTQAVSELEAFSYTVSHDLRAPLQAINGFTGLLLENSRSRLQPEEVDYLHMVDRAAHRMQTLIDNLLDFSTVSHGELRCREVDLSEMARSTAAELLLSEQGRVVDFRIAERVSAIGDPSLLQVVLANLLGNAWKYTGKKDAAVIEFGSLLSGGVPIYFVRDNGDGFDMSLAGSLFTPFQRLHRSDQFEGTGIGLATVKRIVIRHGGAIRALGRPGAGAVFCFTFQHVGDETIDAVIDATGFLSTGG